jgi:hypothetical protein
MVIEQSAVMVATLPGKRTGRFWAVVMTAGCHRDLAVDTAELEAIEEVQV